MVDWYFNISEWGKGQVQWFLQFWISIITRKKPYIAENSGLHSYLNNCNTSWFVPHWNLPGGFFWSPSLLKYAVLCPQSADWMIALYNPVQPCPSNSLVGNIFKGINIRRVMKQFMKMSFQALDWLHQPKALRNCSGCCGSLHWPQNQPLTANVGWVPILDLVYE